MTFIRAQSWTVCFKIFAMSFKEKFKMRPQDPSVALNYGASTKLWHRILLGIVKLQGKQKAKV